MTKKSWFVYILAASLFAGVGSLVGYAFGHGTIEQQATFQATTPVVESTREFPGADRNYVGSGLWHVLSEVSPGTYDVTSTSGTFGCSWWRLKANNDKPKSVIASGTFSRGGFDTFTIASTGKYLKLLGDCVWKREQ